jgi:hypothetical protein
MWWVGGGDTRVRGKKSKGESNWTKGQRKRGVKREKRRSEIKKSTKILLTRIVVHTILPVRQ